MFLTVLSLLAPVDRGHELERGVDLIKLEMRLQPPLETTEIDLVPSTAQLAPPPPAPLTLL
jgi:hypothetical protein